MAKRDQRGLGTYAEFTDSNGSRVRVKDSSSAGAPCVWVFCHNDRHGTASRPGAPLDFTPHLTVAQAKRLRDGLDKFIRAATKAGGEGP